MRPARFAIAPVFAAATVLAGAAAAQDGAVVFDNAIDPDQLDALMAPATQAQASQTLFEGWQMSLELHENAVNAGASEAELAALTTARDAAADAYAAALMAENTVLLASAGMVPLSDEMITDLFATE